MENKTVFKVGQDVYCGLFGHWGKITKIDKSSSYPIEVRTKSKRCYDYTNDGRYSDDMVKSLSFTEFKFEGVDQTPPRKPYEVGDVVYDIAFKVAGEVIRINKDQRYSVVVVFRNENRKIIYSYADCGKRFYDDLYPSLSYTPYNYENGGFT